ncbi:MAG: TonB-dependent receptor [Betaproteobacteria bacterium]|nr:TonB-dependent receptor [Betaproteobacteria bacterium]
MTRRSCSNACALLLYVALPAAAQAPVADEQIIPQLVISATRVTQDGFNLPMAIDRIDADVISEGKPQVNLSEALNRVPGIVVQNRQNYAQDLQMSSRGFGARSTFGVRGVRLIADGIPATMPDGQGQAATFSLSSAERIEVLRGPFASLYGNSSGGVVQIFTADGPTVPTITNSFYAGSYGTQKYGLQFGGQLDSVNYLVDISRFDTDGYRAHSAATRDQLNAKFKLPLGNGKLTLVVNALSQPDTQDPLGLTRAQVQADPRQVDTSAITFNTRKSIRQNQLGAVYDLGDASDTAGALQARLYGGGRTVKQFLGQDGNTPLGAGGVVDLDRTYGGVGLRWSRRFSLNAAANRALTFSAGFDGDRLDERRRGFVNNAGTQGAIKRDEDDRVANTDFYTQAEWQLSDKLSLSGGARHSRVKFDSRDAYIVGVNADDSGKVSYSRTTPLLGVLAKLAPRWNLYANYGEGFETPTFAELAYRPNGATGLNFALQPATSRHAEFGVKGVLGGSTRINASLFRIDTRNEIVTNGSSGGRSDFRNASQTQRDGFELSFESVLPLGLETYAAYTWLDARFKDTYSAGTPLVVVLAGNMLPGVAQSVLYGELVWRHQPSGFHAAIEYRASGKVYVNEANSGAAAGFGVANMRAGFKQQLSGGVLGNWRISEFVRIDNVTDHRYIGSVIVAEARGRFFEPAPGRNVLVGINAAYSF